MRSSELFFKKTPGRDNMSTFAGLFLLVQMLLKMFVLLSDSPPYLRVLSLIDMLKGRLKFRESGGKSLLFLTKSW